MSTNGRHPTRQRPEGNLSRDISRAMVNLLKDYMGRGASHARAYIHGDLVVVVLHRTMTKAERTLADEGEEAVVRDMRQVLKGKFREDANRIVGRLTGQRVSAFLSDHDVDEDIVVQAFVLEPAPGRAVSQGSVEAFRIAADPGLGNGRTDASASCATDEEEKAERLVDSLSQPRESGSGPQARPLT